MRPGTAVALLVFLLLLIGLATVNSAIILLAFPFFLYLSLSLLAQPQPLQLEVTRTLSEERVPAGQPIQVTIQVTNLGTAVPDLLVQDILPHSVKLTEDENRRLISLAANATHTFTYSVRAPRGFHSFNQIVATAREPFGLLRRETFLTVWDELLAFLSPRPSSLKQIGIHPRQTRVYSGVIPARAGGEGTDFFGVRNYQHGDSMRRINWHASARHRRALFTNEFEQERVADVGIILDARQNSNLPHEDQSLLEYSIEAATLMVNAFINQGDRVALLIYGHTVDYTLPGYGKIQRERILHALTRAQLGQSQVFNALNALPTRLFPAKSQIVFISPMLPNDVPFLRRLRSFDYEVLLVSPNPVIYETQILDDSPDVALAAQLAQTEREMMVAELLQAGIFVLDWDIERPFDDVAQARLRSTRLRHL